MGVQYLSVDRIESGMAFCEDEDRVIAEIPLDILPENIREGSVIRAEDGVYTLDPDEETRRRKMNYNLFKSLLQEDSTDGGSEPYNP